MSSTYSTFKIEMPGAGDQSGTWGATVNTNLGTTMEEAIGGYGNPAYPSDADYTLTYSDSNAAQTFRCLYFLVTGTISATRNLTVPAIRKMYLIKNSTTGGQSINIRIGTSTGTTIPNGKTMAVYATGTDVIQAFNYVPGVTSTLDAITAATGSVTNANGVNAITWNWAQTAASQNAFNFGETTAAINGAGNQVLVKIGTLATSTSDPFLVQALGADVFRVNRSSGAVFTPSSFSVSATSSAAIQTGSGANLSLTVGAGTGVAAGIVQITGGISGAAQTGNSGGVVITGGAAGTVASMAGGPVVITGGVGSTTTTGGIGGAVTITAGNGGLALAGGVATLKGGNGGASGAGGNVAITSGNGNSAVGGDIVITPGTGSSNGAVNFVNCDVANGAVATIMSNFGPTGASATIVGWLKVKVNGTARYMPYW